MSNVAGLVSLSLSLTDSTAFPTKTVVKTISVSEDSEVSTGVVAIVSGTVGTAAATIGLEPTTYRNSAGAFVSFTDAPTRVVLQAQNANQVYATDVDLGVMKLLSGSNQFSVCSWPTGSQPASGISLAALSGTNSYTLVILRETA